MKIYHLKRSQLLPISIQEAWRFFATPKNLQKITPPHMGFRITYMSGGERMYPGQIIQYKVNILPGIPVDWTTEITHVQEPFYFVDEQRSGPYALWHHQHHFRETKDGVDVVDEVSYAIPFGFFGRLASAHLVRKQLNRIFDHRKQVLKEHFTKQSTLV